jgi:hypothetical protein
MSPASTRTTLSAQSSRPPNPDVFSKDGVPQLANNTTSWTMTWNAPRTVSSLASTMISEEIQSFPVHQLFLFFNIII